MREILFRGKRTDNGEWVYGDLIRHYENQRRFIAREQMAYTTRDCGIERIISENYNEVIPETVGQYTGLKDKNGAKIFEGDILKGHKTHFDLFGVATVKIGEYIDSKLRDIDLGENKDITLCGVFITLNFGDLSISSEETQMYEVIGNIHDKEETE